MAKYTTITCDMCGSSELGRYIIIKAKQYWHSWLEDGFYGTKIYICEHCQNRIKAAAVHERKAYEREQTTE